MQSNLCSALEEEEEEEEGGGGGEGEEEEEALSLWKAKENC
jgi:hypothetical protein